MKNIVVILGETILSSELVTKLQILQVEIFSINNLDGIKKLISDKEEEDFGFDFKFMIIATKDIELQLINDIYEKINYESAYVTYVYRIGIFEEEEKIFGLIDDYILTETEIDWKSTFHLDLN